MSHHVCWTHADCADGVASQWVFDKYIRHRIAEHERDMDRDQWKITYEIKEVIYNKPPPLLFQPSHLYILDFTFDLATTRALFESEYVLSLTILDHHPRMREIVEAFAGEPLMPEGVRATYINMGAEKNVVFVYEKEASGALMAWHYFSQEWVGDEIPDLIRHVSDRDLWQFKLPDTEQFMEGLFTYPMNLTAWNALTDYHGDGLKDHLMAVGATALRIRDNHIDWAIKNTARTVNFTMPDEVPVGLLMINAGHPLASKAAVELERRLPGFDGYMAYWDLPDDQGRKFSIRHSTKEVKPIAEFFGGGGHPKAAGFVVPRDHWLARY